MRAEQIPAERPNCELCGDPMPPGEEMFKYHGYSGPCPKPPLPQAQVGTMAEMERRNHDAECESELTSHGQTPCRCDERSAPPDIPVCGVEHAPGSRVEECYFCLLKQRDDIAMSRDELLEFVKEVAGLSLLIADNGREFKLIQRARTLVGQPEF